MQQTPGTTLHAEAGDQVEEPGIMRRKPAMLARDTIPAPVTFSRAGEGDRATIPVDLDLAEQVKYYCYLAASGQINDLDDAEDCDNAKDPDYDPSIDLVDMSEFLEDSLEDGDFTFGQDCETVHDVSVPNVIFDEMVECEEAAMVPPLDNSGNELLAVPNVDYMMDDTSNEKLGRGRMQL